MSDVMPEPGIDGSEGMPARQSVRDRIRARRDELAQEVTLDLLVPGYGGELGVRYRGIPDTEMEKFASHASKTKAGIRAGCDLIAKSCEAVLVRPVEDGELEVLEDEKGEPIRFDERLAEYLGLDSRSVRDTVIQTFAVGGQTLAHMEHAVAIQNWMSGKLDEIDPGLLGE